MKKLFFLFLIHPVRTYRFVDFCVRSVLAELQRLDFDQVQASFWDSTNNEE